MHSRSSGVGQSTFTRSEWNRLTRLPGRIVVAATSAEPDKDRHTVAEGLAGIDAIAAGRNSANPLVRNVVSAIYASEEDDAPTAEQLSDVPRGLAAVLAECRQVSASITDRVDREAYAAWLASIGSRVCRAARSGGVLGIGADQVSPAESAFLAKLAGAFRR